MTPHGDVVLTTIDQFESHMEHLSHNATILGVIGLMEDTAR